jgi:hypothetical protein
MQEISYNEQIKESRMLLWEIIKNIKPLPFEWQDNIHARFNSIHARYGIVYEKKKLAVLNKTLSVTNIVFGTLETESGSFSQKELNLSLTGYGNIREVFATVGAAVIANKPKTNLIVIGAGDNVKEKRSHLYSLAISDIISDLPEYADVYYVEDKVGNKLTVMSDENLSKEMQIELAKLIGLDKLIEGPV